jgi:hypothetical protein
MRTKASRNCGRPIDFLRCRVVIFFVFIFLLRVTCIKLLSSSARNQEPSSRGALNSGLTSADSGLQLDSEIAPGGVPAEVQPHGLIQPCRGCVETSRDVIEHAFTSAAKNASTFYFTSRWCPSVHFPREVNGRTKAFALALSQRYKERRGEAKAGGREF